VYHQNNKTENYQNYEAEQNFNFQLAGRAIEKLQVL